MMEENLNIIKFEAHDLGCSRRVSLLLTIAFTIMQYPLFLSLTRLHFQHPPAPSWPGTARVTSTHGPWRFLTMEVNFIAFELPEWKRYEPGINISVVVFLTKSATAVSDDFTVPRIMGDNMVFQRAGKRKGR
jgi:hypothetical protein